MKDFLKQYFPYYKDYTGRFILVFIGIVLVSIGTSGTAYVIKPLLDEIFVNKDKQMLHLLPFLIVALYSAKGIGRYLQAYYISYIGEDIIRRVRDKLLFHILNLDLIFFSQKHSGELVSRITNDINRIQSAISNQFARIVQETMTIVALTGVVIYQSPLLAFYGLVVMPLTLYPLSRLAKRMKKLSFSSQEKNADILSTLNEIFNNIEIIKANWANKIETDKFKQHNLDFFQINMKAVKTEELVSPLMEILGSIAIAVVIIIGGDLVIDDKMSVGTFFSFTAALFMLYTPIKSLSSLYNKLQDALAANERINDIFKMEATIISGNHKITTCKEISFKDVVLKFDDKKALNKVSLDVKVGQTIALVGDSGGGKSSFVNALLRFYEIESGDITIDGINLKQFDIKSLRDMISIVTQRTYIFNSTIAQNITYGHKFDEQKLNLAISQAHAKEFIDKLPNGVNTTLDQFGTNLSGGQRQRIAIARALYKDPKILILDEATSALDNKSESIITDIIQEVSNNKIVLVIAHRLSTIKNADKIAVFKDGKIVCIGNQEQLLKDCLEYQRLYNTGE